MLKIVKSYLLISALTIGLSYSTKAQGADSLVMVHMSQIDSALVKFSLLDECLDIQALKMAQISLKQAEIDELVGVRGGLELIIFNQGKIISNSDSIDSIQTRVIRSKDKEIRKQKRHKWLAFMFSGLVFGLSQI